MSLVEEMPSKCKIEGCNKQTQGAGGHCKAHGGGRRCLQRAVISMLKEQEINVKLMGERMGEEMSDRGL